MTRAETLRVCEAGTERVGKWGRAVATRKHNKMDRDNGGISKESNQVVAITPRTLTAFAAVQ